MSHSYSSDISREQFARILPCLESARRRTKPRTVDLYDVFCGVLYLLKSGCQWRMLPADFPDWRTCYKYFRQWSERPDPAKYSILEQVLEPVYNLFRISTAKARTTICRLVLSFLSQFFQRRRHFSSQPKDRSTTHRFGSTTKVCSSLRFTTSTEAPSRLCTAVAKGFPVYPPSTSTFCTWLRLARCI